MEEKKIVWLTGASTGIGLAIAKTLIKNGYFVYAVSRRPGVIESELGKNNENYTALHCNISDLDSITETHKEIISRSGKIDVLINNAGVTEFKSFIDTSIDDFDNIMDTNVRGAFLCIKSVVEEMVNRKSGLIINILSIAAISRLTNSSIYSASKSAVMSLSNILREEVRKDHVKICNILPGATDTEMWAEDMREKFRDKMMTPETISNIVDYVLRAPGDTAIEEIILKPTEGNL